ncbi:hypothetical protein AMTRI_Chr03g142860 [Amborella trichopoda]
MRELQKVEDNDVVWRCGERVEAVAAVATWLRVGKKRWLRMEDREQQGGGNSRGWGQQLRWSREMMTAGYQRVGKEAATEVDRSRDGRVAKHCQVVAKWGVAG